jgi:sporulation protein YlmC with PRC-barrel domain
MKGFRSSLAVGLMAIAVSGPALAQSQSLPPYMTADHNMRTSKLIGMTVYNDHNEKIGTIDDIVLPGGGGGEASAVLSVGGYLGVGQKLIKVPISHVHLGDDKPMMEGGKPELSKMSAYSYTTISNPG